MSEQAIEKRLERVEREVEQIKSQLNSGSGTGWISRMRGQFRDDPVFDEIVRLGKEIRDAELPPDSGDEHQD